MTPSISAASTPPVEAPIAPLVPRKPMPKRRRLGVLGRMGRRLRTVGHLFTHLRQTGRWWLVPMAVVFLAAASLLVVVQVIEYAAPFVYTLF